MSTKNILYSILSGILLTASFPPGKLDWMVWFALVPLFISLRKKSPSQAFKLGLIAGLTHYLTLVYWIIVALKNYGGLNFLISSGVLLLLCIYLSLYPAFFSYLFSYIKGYRFAAFVMASIWVGMEYIRAKILTGFPWCLLGHTQFEHINLIQIADLVGVYGLSFLIVLSNITIYTLFLDRTSDKRGFLKWELPAIVLMVLFTVAYGHYRLTGDKTREKNPQSMKVAIIQGNIDQSIKWKPAFQEKTVDIYRRLTRLTSGFKPDLVVWPETSVPFFFQDNIKFSPKVFEITKESGADLIFGSPAYRRDGTGTRFYNRAYLLSPDGELSGYYDKVHLVPFGEYVPLKRFLPFVRRLVPAAGDFASGEKLEPLRRPPLSAGILICFEVIFPKLARAQTREGAKILVNMTNDAWFGMTSAPYQHLAMAVFRAVENRRPLIRAANTGFSAFIGPQGKIITQSGLFREEALRQEVNLGDSSLTLYTRYGDVFAFSLLIIGLMKILHTLWYIKRS
jgi:apolipoprotein N-acyltransferase